MHGFGISKPIVLHKWTFYFFPTKFALGMPLLKLLHVSFHGALSKLTFQVLITRSNVQQNLHKLKVTKKMKLWLNSKVLLSHTGNCFQQTMKKQRKACNYRPEETESDNRHAFDHYLRIRLSVDIFFILQLYIFLKRLK